MLGGNAPTLRWAADTIDNFCGFSIGVGNTIADLATKASITRAIANRKGDMSKIIDDATHDLNASPGMTICELFENLWSASWIWRATHRVSTRRNN